MMCWRERPASFGPEPIGPHTLVAMTIAGRLRRAAIQAPSTVADSPPLLPGAHREYTSAVSMKLPPASTYASSTASEAFWSVVHPNVLPPKQRAATFNPLRPSFRISMRGDLPSRVMSHCKPSRTEPPWYDHAPSNLVPSGRPTWELLLRTSRS